MTTKQILSGPSPVIIENTNDIQLDLWLNEALTYLPEISYCEEIVDYFEIVDGVLILPSTIKTIYDIILQVKSDTDCSKELNCEPELLRPQVCRIQIYAKLTLDYKDCYIRPKYVGSNKTLLNACQSCHPDYTYVIDGCKLYSNFDGDVCIRYISPKFNDGSLEINSSNAQNLVMMYIMQQYFLSESLRNKQGAFNQYDYFKKQFDIAVLKCKGESALRNVNADLVKQVNFGYLNTVKNVR